jgi:putative flippase GtrA
MTRSASPRLPVGELLRYGLNGVVATAAHFAALTLNLEVFHFASAGWANFCAALVGITVSFLGSRYFVYARTGQRLITEATRFAGLYGAIAVLHGLVLSGWTDWLKLDYRWGFLLATVLQVSLSYLGNKFLVFKR